MRLFDLALPRTSLSLHLGMRWLEISRFLVDWTLAIRLSLQNYPAQLLR